MDSAGLRRRGQTAPYSNDVHMEKYRESPENHEHFEPPKYTVDLSLPPNQRYRHVAADFKPQAVTLPVLFDEIAEQMNPKVSIRKVRWFARSMLRRVYYKEETEELRGISEVIGLELWLLVALNVLLDLFMGCTSGAVKVDDLQGATKMLHLRTLDWGMPALRKVIVQLDFVHRPGGEVIASSITYVGYVGVLTGVRKGLSISLNFRPNHDDRTRYANFRFYFHHLLVLLGYRPSISSLLRRCLIPVRSSETSEKALPTLDSIERNLPSTTTTAAYLIFNDGDRCLTMEKDHHTAIIRSSTDFIVTTNHDAAEEHAPPSISADSHGGSLKDLIAGMSDMTEDSVYRTRLATKLWKASSRKRHGSNSKGSNALPTQEKVVEWMNTFPIANEMTHFAAIMDPKAGKVVWIKRYLEPFEPELQL